MAQRECAGKLEAQSVLQAMRRTKKALKKENNRVKDFEKGLGIINELCNKTNTDDKETGVLWGGDFNPRSVETNGQKIGCAMFPTGSFEADLASFQASRDILGSRATDANDLVKFTDVLASTGLDLREAEGLKCPTYKKGKQKVADEGAEHSQQFQCFEDGSWMYYKVSHSPSWTDRIFHSSSKPWLECENAHRVTHLSDHDAVLLTCVVKTDRTDLCSGVEGNVDQLGARCCCKSAEDCVLKFKEDLATSKNPFKLLGKVCPDPYHNFKRFHSRKLPEACAAALNMKLATLDKS